MLLTSLPIIRSPLAPAWAFSMIAPNAMEMFSRAWPATQNKKRGGDRWGGGGGRAGGDSIGDSTERSRIEIDRDGGCKARGVEGIGATCVPDRLETGPCRIKYINIVAGV